MALARPPAPYPDPSWWGWGDPAQVPVLTDRILSLLRDGLGVRAGLPHPGAVADVALPPSRLPPDAVAALTCASLVMVSGRVCTSIGIVYRTYVLLSMRVVSLQEGSLTPQRLAALRKPL